MKKILITGANGQLGKKIKDESLKYKDIEFFFTDIEELDICNNSQIDSFIEKIKPQIIVNCAAYTNVELAETHEAEAYLINSIAARFIATNAAKHNAKFIHISTDYVFDGEKNLPYNENDKTNPVSIYGKSKFEGELSVNNTNNDSIIIRTSWLYSEYGKNFLLSMLNAAKTKNNISVVYDQIGTPTYAGDLARCILTICEQYFTNNKWNSGIYHFSNLGVASWYDFAYHILKTNKNVIVNPILSNEYPSEAKRPNYSILDKSKIITTFEIKIPHWTDSCDICLKNYNNLLKNKK